MLEGIKRIVEDYKVKCSFSDASLVDEPNKGAESVSLEAPGADVVASSGAERASEAPACSGMALKSSILALGPIHESLVVLLRESNLILSRKI